MICRIDYAACLIRLMYGSQCDYGVFNGRLGVAELEHDAIPEG